MPVIDDCLDALSTAGIDYQTDFRTGDALTGNGKNGNDRVSSGQRIDNVNDRGGTGLYLVSGAIVCQLSPHDVRNTPGFLVDSDRSDCVRRHVVSPIARSS